MPDELIATTAGLRCPVCGLVPHGEHERVAVPAGAKEAVCGTCHRFEISFQPDLEALEARVAALEEAQALYRAQKTPRK